MEKEYLLMDDSEYVLGIPTIVDLDETSERIISEVMEKFNLTAEEE